MKLSFSSTVEEVIALVREHHGNCVPIWTSLPGDILTPVLAYLRLTNGASLDAPPSFLLEGVFEGSHQGRYSFVGSDPYHVIRTGPNEKLQGDPLVHLREELSKYRHVPVPGTPPFTGGAIGYFAYDCVRHFEPYLVKREKAELKDPLGIPESVHMLCDSIVAFDHLFQSVKVLSHVILRSDEAADDEIRASYRAATERIAGMVERITSSSPIQLPHQPPIPPKAQRAEAKSNIGEAGYKDHVRRMKEHIVQGDIIQGVPSQRLARPTALHPFNAYRHLRQVNPSPYMFYVHCSSDLQLVGASPECLCKVEKNVVTNHAIAGTIKRGATAEGAFAAPSETMTPTDDTRLAAELANSTKDRAEHIMLVDLARNDVNRVCDPKTVKVDSLMQVERFSHVMHLTSQVSGRLRAGKTRYDAFRSIFPAGTVSGAPKIRAMELISELEKERRGVYAGAVGRWNFEESDMDTCIALRTMTFKDGVAYLQAGGGIVFDSDEQEEYVETLNKLAGNVTALSRAEGAFGAQQLN